MTHKEEKELLRYIKQNINKNVRLYHDIEKNIELLNLEQCIQVLNYVSDDDLRSTLAIMFARCHETEKNKFIDYVQSSRGAYFWVLNIGDREVMRDRVTESEWAYWWAYQIGDREVMRDRVTEKNIVMLWVNSFVEDIGFFKNKYPHFFD